MNVPELFGKKNIDFVQTPEPGLLKNNCDVPLVTFKRYIIMAVASFVLLIWGVLSELKQHQRRLV
jgi:hypothetical protein